MQTRVRALVSDDLEPLVALSLRAWEPVFASLRDALGQRLFELLRGDWRESQATDVRRVLTDQAVAAWVAEADGELAGFVAATVHGDSGIGEIVMVAVDPERQQAGVGSTLTASATNWLHDNGVTVAIVETGGDPGHLPARSTYESAGFTPLAVMRYFKLLEPDRIDPPPGG